MPGRDAAPRNHAQRVPRGTASFLPGCDLAAAAIVPGPRRIGALEAKIRRGFPPLRGTARWHIPCDSIPTCERAAAEGERRALLAGGARAARRKGRIR